MNPYNYWPMSITVFGLYAVVVVGFTFGVIRWVMDRRRSC